MTAEQYEAYIDTLSKELQRSQVGLGIFVAIGLVGIVFLIAVLIKYAKYPKKDSIIWYVGLGVWCTIFVLGLVSQIPTLCNLTHDINNRSFVVYNGNAVIEENTFVQGKTTKTEYCILLKDDMNETEITVSRNDAVSYGLSVGNFSDIVVVYAERSKVLVDVYINDNVDLSV